MSNDANQRQIEESAYFAAYDEGKAAGEAQLAQLHGELAAMREALEKVEWVPDGDGWTDCPWCGSWFEKSNEHKPDCPRQLALSGQRGAQLAAVLKAVGELDTFWETTQEDGPLTPFGEEVWKVVSAYRAAFPPEKEVKSD